jgi:hypothetical protein
MNSKILLVEIFIIITCIPIMALIAIMIIPFIILVLLISFVDMLDNYIVQSRCIEKE